VTSGEEFVRRIFDRWNAGDHSVPPEEADPELEVHSAMTQRVYRGVDGAERWIREIDEQFSDWRLAVDTIEEPRDGVLVATGSITMRGRKSGLDLEQPASWTFEIRAGRLLRLRNFAERDAAAEFAAREG
jgi:ketosteroid isomerase-like protein